MDADKIRTKKQIPNKLVNPVRLFSCFSSALIGVYLRLPGFAG